MKTVKDLKHEINKILVELTEEEQDKLISIIVDDKKRRTLAKKLAEEAVKELEKTKRVEAELPEIIEEFSFRDGDTMFIVENKKRKGI